MDKMKIAIQLLVIRTSFYPFNIIYYFIYKISIFIAWLLLSRVNGLVSLYLRRGAAKGEIIYGLSDIDLLVIIKNENAGQTRKNIVRRYIVLSRLIPLFGNAKRELAIYTKNEILILYKDYPFYCGWFTEGKTTWQLLWGENFVNTLPEANNGQLCIAALEEFKVWWIHLVNDIFTDCSPPLFKRRYLWYKVISEAARAYLFIVHREKIYLRDEALIRVRTFLSVNDKKYVDQIIRYRQCLLGGGEIHINELLTLYIKLLYESHRTIYNEIIVNKEYGNACLEIGSIITPIDNSNLIKNIKILKTLLIEVDKISVDEVLIIPKIEFYLDVVNNSDFGSFNIVLITNNEITQKNLLDIRTRLNAITEFSAYEVFIVFREYQVALSVTINNKLNCIKSFFTDPIFFHIITTLKNNEKLALCNRQKTHVFTLSKFVFTDVISRREEIVDQVLDGVMILKTKEKEFMEFFLSAARTKLINKCINNDTIFIPVDELQIINMLSNFFPASNEWLQTLHHQYQKVLRGHNNTMYKMYVPMLNFLRKINQG